jgi:hypothetical protein
MIAAAFLALALTTGAVRVEPPAVTLGEKGGAVLRIDVDEGAGEARIPATVQLSTNVGEVTKVESLGGGHFRARFRPPDAHAPGVALLLVEVRRGKTVTREWVSLPLLARADLKVLTKPRATVKVDVGSLHFGPKVANRRGRVTVPVRVPPGVSAAIVHSQDRAGNASEKPIPLELEAYPQVRALTSRDTASWADATPLEVEAFAVSSGGEPLTDAASLRAEAALGTLGPARRTPGGAFVFVYRAPEHLTAAEDRITFSVAGGAPVALTVPLRAGPPAKVAGALEPSTYLAGSGQRIAVRVQVTDAKGNPVPPGRPTVTATGGRLRTSVDGRVLEVPDAFEGRPSLSVRAKVGALSGERRLRLTPAPAARAALELDRGYAVAGSPLEGRLVLRDRFGNPTAAEGVEVVAQDGSRAEVRPAKEGGLRVRYTPSAPGPLSLEVRRGGETLGHTGAITDLAGPEGWEVSASLALVAQSNLAKAKGVYPRLGVGWRLGRSHFELLAEVDLRLYSGFDAALDGVGARGSMHGFAVGLGARYTRPIGVNWTVHGAVLIGGARLRSTLSGQGAFEGTEGSEIHSSPMLRFAGGPAYRVGRGRVFAELTLESTPLVGHVTGNAGGVGLAVGYRYPF